MLAEGVGARRKPHNSKNPKNFRRRFVLGEEISYINVLSDPAQYYVLGFFLSNHVSFTSFFILFLYKI
jgi:hypothetical protein